MAAKFQEKGGQKQAKLLLYLELNGLYVFLLAGGMHRVSRESLLTMMNGMDERRPTVNVTRARCK